VSTMPSRIFRLKASASLPLAHAFRVDEQGVLLVYGRALQRVVTMELKPDPESRR
jgi:hypothetical protein